MKDVYEREYTRALIGQRAYVVGENVLFPPSCLLSDAEDPSTDKCTKRVVSIDVSREEVIVKFEDDSFLASGFANAILAGEIVAMIDRRE